MDSDGSETTRLTKSQSINRRPAWSPDGQFIVFEREGNIYSMRADGSGVFNLTQHAPGTKSSVCLCSTH
jgi:Tol biopolymer transport system component